MGNDRAKTFEVFESDRMDRRRFIQAMGAGAAAALAGCTVPPLGDSEQIKGLAKATAVNHLAYAVSDVGRTRDFYVEMFGMKVAWDDGRRCSVEFGDPAKPEAIYIGTGTASRTWRVAPSRAKKASKLPPSAISCYACATS